MAHSVRDSVRDSQPARAVAMSLLGHAARLGATLSTVLRRRAAGNGGVRKTSNTLVLGNEQDLQSLLPSVDDIVEAQYNGRKSRRNWGYRGVQVTAVNLVNEEQEGYPNYTYVVHEELWLVGGWVGCW